MENVGEDFEIKSLKLSLHRPDRSDHWTRYAAGSSRICPPHGLPIWYQLPLDRKLPFISIPPGTVFFSRGWPGEQLWSREKAHDLRLYDSEGHVLYLSYDALHDPHLARHHQKSSVTKCLQRAGHINPDGSASCTLKNMNTFREVVRMMNLDQVHHGIQHETEAQEEARRLNQIEEELKRKKEKNDLQQKLEEAAAERNQMRAQKEMEKEKRWVQNQKMKLNRLKRLKELRQQKQEYQSYKCEIKAERVQKNLECLAASEKMKKLRQIRKMKERERRLENQRNKRLQENDQKRLEEIKTRWERKVAEMTQSYAVAQVMLADVMEAHRAQVEKRKQLAVKEKLRQEAVALEMRRKRAEKRAELQKKLKETQMRRSIFATWLPLAGYQISANTQYHVNKSIRSTLSAYTKISNEGADSYLAMMVCKKFFERTREIPPPVASVVDYILEGAIEGWVRKILKPLIDEAKRTVLDYGTTILQELKASRSKKPQRVIEMEKEQMEESIIVRPKERKAVRYCSSNEERRSQARRSFMEAYLLLNKSRRSSNQNFDKETSCARFRDEAQAATTSLEGKGPKILTKKLLFQSDEEKSPDSKIRSTLGIDRPSMIPSIRIKKASSVRFGRVEEIKVLHFPDDVRSVRGRKMTPVPSLENLAQLAWIDSPISPASTAEEHEEWQFPEKVNLEKVCVKTMTRIVAAAKKLIEDTVEPTTRLKTIKKLVSIQEHKTESLHRILAKAVLNNESRNEKLRIRRMGGGSSEQAVAEGVARWAVDRLLHPSEFRRKLNEFAIRYRIMFTAPPNPQKKTLAK